MFETTLVIVVAFVVWMAMEGWIIKMPKAMGVPVRLRFKKLSKRFSLRSLLLVFTAMALVLGLVIWAVRG